MNRVDEIVELTAQAGEMLLSCGAEIARVEETMTRMARHYQVSGVELFVVTNGIFISLELEGQRGQSIRSVPQVTVNLTKVSLVNQISREIESGRYQPEDALRRLRQIERMPVMRSRWLVLASALCCGSYCFLFGGDLWDSAGAFLCGLLLYPFLWWGRRRKLPGVLLHLLGAALVTVLSFWQTQLGWVHNLDMVVAGSIITMIPGMAFVNGVRDIAGGDYLSGSIRMMDAVLKIIGIAAGVGLVLSMAHIS